MDLKLKKNVLHNKTQKLNVDKVAVLMGENGSGKSLILQSVFDQKLKGKTYKDLTVVCFSSGQNESFSLPFGRYLSRKRKEERENKNGSIHLSCFYFDKTWARLLIFLATSLKKEGKVRSFLTAHHYVDESDDGYKEDISTILNCKFRVEKEYTALVAGALEQEKKGSIDTFRTTSFFRILEGFISNIVDNDYDFEHSLSKEIEIDSLTLSNFFLNFGLPPKNEQMTAHLTPEMSFFTQASANNYFIDKSKNKLLFKESLELSQLSDGEYQILYLYALLDLFDSENTLFLLDEVDSHLHCKNVELLWKNLHRIKGNAITTTHLLDSITAKENIIDHLKLVEKGEINEANKNRQLIERLEVLSQAQSTEYALYANLPYLVLIDDHDDWYVFTLLAQRKGLDVKILEKIHIVKVPSGYATIDNIFAKEKLRWLSNFRQFTQERQTKHIFLLCDRDEATLNFYNSDNIHVSSCKSKLAEARGHNKPIPVSLLAWQRREIKHYLLSYKALQHHGKLDDINDNLSLNCQLKPNNPSDNDDLRRLKSDIVKNVIDDFIYVRQGSSVEKTFSMENLQVYIDLIPPEEISEDIENMYNFIMEKIK